MADLKTVVLYTLIPVAAAATAGGVAAIRPPRARMTSALQHLAAGVVFAAAAIELLPELLKHSPVPTLVGFAIGIAVMFALRWVGDQVERTGQGAAGLIAVTGVDFLVDGLVLGAGFAAGGQTGLLLTVAIAIEYLLSTAIRLAPDSPGRRFSALALDFSSSVGCRVMPRVGCGRASSSRSRPGPPR